MDDKTICRVYRTIMLVILTSFITFLLTTVGLYAYVKNDDDLLLIKRNQMGTIASELYTFRGVIDKYYLGEVDEQKLKEGAIAGYVAGLGDPYTQYIPPEEFEEYLEDTKGNYVGIGVILTSDKEADKVKVVAITKDSPAEKAGILPGDYIIGVEDKTYTASQLSEMTEDMKGKEGTEVRLIITRGEETKMLTLKREKVKLNPLESKMLENNIGYINFTSFDEGTAEDFKTNYYSLKDQGMAYLIIDLRNNGGGIVDEAVKIADYMLEKGKDILFEVDKNGTETVKKSEEDPIVDIPVVLLVNKNSASASEMLAGALKDWGRAKIVGTTTFGKGIIQEVLSIKDSGGIKITTNEYQTPNHNKINKAGIEPDVKVELPEELKEEYEIPEEKDEQLKKAKEVVVQEQN